MLSVNQYLYLIVLSFKSNLLIWLKSRVGSRGILQSEEHTTSIILVSTKISEKGKLSKTNKFYQEKKSENPWEDFFFVHCFVCSIIQFRLLYASVGPN